MGQTHQLILENLAERQETGDTGLHGRCFRSLFYLQDTGAGKCHFRNLLRLLAKDLAMPTSLWAPVLGHLRPSQASSPAGAQPHSPAGLLCPESTAMTHLCPPRGLGLRPTHQYTSTSPGIPFSSIRTWLQPPVGWY